ncbi:MAG: hypothetical protein ABI238_02080 [Terrimesophilobacter sp.]
MVRKHILGDLGSIVAWTNGLGAVGITVFGALALRCGGVAASWAAPPSPEPLLIAAATITTGWTISMLAVPLGAVTIGAVPLGDA